MRKAIPFSRKEVYLIIWVAVFFIFSVLYMRGTYYFGTRHGLLLGIPAMAWAAIGSLELKDRFKGFVQKTTSSQRILKTSFIVMPCLVVTVLFAQAIITSTNNDKMDLKLTGIELRKKGYDKSVMFIQPGLQRLAFYADSDYVTMPDGIKTSDIVVLMKKFKATILVVDLDSIDNVVPAFQAGMERAKFKTIETTERSKRSGYSLAVYKLRDL